MHPYRTHNCAELRPAHTGSKARLSGWIHAKRDHGNLLFVDLRDHHGLTQCVIDTSKARYSRTIEGVRGLESVLTVTGDGGRAHRRHHQPTTLPTGQDRSCSIAEELTVVESAAEVCCPCRSNSDEDSQRGDTAALPLSSIYAATKCKTQHFAAKSNVICINP